MSEIKVNSIKGVGASASAILIHNSDGTCTLASGSKLNNCTTDGTTNLTIADGNLVVGTSGHGIDFSATSGTGTSELFSDYEEGQYDPTPTGTSGQTNVSIYASEATLNYTKIGNLVTVSGRIRMENVNYSGGLRITLPFTAANSTNTSNLGSSAISTHGVNVFDDTIGLFLETAHNQAYADFLITRDNSSWIGANNSYILADSYLSFQHTYTAA